MPWFVYIVRCSDKSYYTGICKDLKRRVQEHNGEKYKRIYTKGRTPVKLVYWEAVKDRSGATKREIEIKSISRVQKEKLIESFVGENSTGSSSVGPGPSGRWPRG